MGKIKKILENELVGGSQSTDVYPVTSIKAVYDENNERLDYILNRRGVVNVSTNYNNDHIAEVLTLGKAINKVPSSDRTLGYVMTFLTSKGWVSYQFGGDSVSDWANQNKWHEYIYSSNLENYISNAADALAYKEVLNYSGIVVLESDPSRWIPVSENYNGVLLHLKPSTTYKVVLPNSARNVIHIYLGNVNSHEYLSTININNGMFTTPNVQAHQMIGVINIALPAIIDGSYYTSIETITTEKLSDSAVTASKIADGAVTTEKLSDAEKLMLQFYASGIQNAILKGGTEIDNSSWADNKVLNQLGVEVESPGYSVSPFIDYNGQFGAVSAVQFNPPASSYSYNSVCFYNKNTKEFLASFPVISGKRIILIPPGYSVRLCTNLSRKGAILSNNASISGADITNDRIADASITNSKIADASITNSKIADASITREKTSGHIALFEFCLTAAQLAIPTEKFADLSVNGDTWETGLLKNNGEIDSAISTYKTSKFIDYGGSYDSPFSALYISLAGSSVSENIYSCIAFYRKDTHSFVASYNLVDGKRMILIPRGYSIRVSTLKSETTISYSKELKIDNLSVKIDNLSVKIDSPVPSEMIADAELSDSGNEILLITSTEENATYEDFMYDGNGNKNYDATFKSITFNTDISSYDFLDVIQFSVGVLNGGFLDANKNYLKGISNATNLAALKVPRGAKYINLTTVPSSRVKTMRCYRRNYKLNSLLVSPKQMDSSSAQEDITKALSIVLSPSNSEYHEDYIWNGTGTKVNGGNYGTIRYKLPKDCTKVNISSYNVGALNGGFISESNNFIKGISNVEDLSNLAVPSGSYYIDITCAKSNVYNTIICYNTQTRFTLPNLSIENRQIVDKENVSINQWYGKKLCIIGTSVAHGSTAETAYGYIAQQKLGFTMIPAGVPGQAIHGKTVSYSEGGIQKTILSPLTYGSGSLTKEEYAAAKTVKDADLSTDVVGMTIPESPNNPTDWAGESKAYNNYYRTWENLFTAENQDVSLWIYATAPNNNNFALDDWNKFDTSNWRYKDGTSFAEHRTTFLGAMLYLMDKMYENQPKARMVLVLDSPFEYNDDRGKGNMELLSKTFNIPLIDLWKKTNTSPKSKMQTLSDNGKNGHPSTFGHEVMGNIFTNELLTIS